MRAPDDVFVLVVSVEGDAEEASAVVHSAQLVGWTVREIILPPFETSHSGATRLEAAACVVVVWSALAARSPALQAIADRANALGRLVAVQVDHAARPDVFDRAVDISHWREGIDTRTRHRLLSTIQAIAGTPPTNQAPRRPVGRRFALAAIGAAAVVLAGLGGSLAWDYYQRQTVDPHTQRAATARPMATTGAADTFAGVDRSDPMALQTFLSRYPTGAAADQARADLGALEARSWADVTQASDSLAALAAISRYRSTFPNGRFLQAAADIEKVELSTATDAATLLNGLGYAAGAGVDADRLRSAVASYQTNMGLKPDARVTPDLLSALRTSVASAAAPSASDDRPTQADPALPAPPLRTSASAPPRPAPEPAKPFRDCFSCPEMTIIPVGVFVLGDGRYRGQADERPARIVSIPYAFALGRKEVTFDEWDACTADGACRYRPQDMGWGRGDRPVINVSFSDAQTYVKWLSAKTGRTYRLPSEAEWEYAARAGSTLDYAFGDDRAQLCAYANIADAASNYEWRNTACADPYPARTAPAGSFRPNAFGLFDMHGNVWEWVEDCWHDGYASSPTDGSAWVVGCTRPDHVLRGGSFSIGPDKARSGYRFAFRDERLPFFGFRVARVVATPPAP